jgi:transposase
MVESYRNGYSIKQIASFYRFSYGAVHSHLKKCDVLRSRGRTKKLGVDDVRRVCAGYSSGESLGALSKRFGVSASSIRYHLMRYGLHIRPVGRPRVREEANGPGEKSIGG